MVTMFFLAMMQLPTWFVSSEPLDPIQMQQRANQTIDMLIQRANQLLNDLQKLIADLERSQIELERSIEKSRAENELSERIVAQAEKVFKTTDPIKKKEASAELQRLLQEYRELRAKHKAEKP